MTVEVITFGCRLNASESEAIRHQAMTAAADRGGELLIVNTCAVTGEATRQARQTIRRLARERPAATIVVTGCAAQIEPHAFAAMPQVARVVGNAEKLEPETWRALAQPAGAELGRTIVGDIMAVRETAGHLAAGHAVKARAFVQVQNGCDHRCTFCIIPFGRGPSRSVPMGAVVDEIRRLTAAGAAEIVLSGVDITSYGDDLPGRPRLGTLVRQVLRHVPELPRLRLSSIDAVEVDGDLLDAFATQARLMPHVHLSLQAGDDLILKRMKRRHGRADAIRLCGALRALRPDLVIGADVIAGFPTETEAMFRRSLELVEECGLTHLHVFPFSPRPGTPAARMPQVPSTAIRERAQRLRQAGADALGRHLDREVGRTRAVLVEGRLARTEAFTPVRLARPEPYGRIIDVAIAGHDGRALAAA
ncbi:tRNA (N(6)-L-threonylcarbamoyladenosine(37)-C(2))-methylthiotransferase MtaB [Chelatococcus reniformis]|uniref:tRNA (N(6)-L-threonylcarbamoyladenosine(37)-C(2))-methylthiotransferase MtaB n=1 Tax=Chelatococcus reniformis TaxID=1494448 RepID=A0A916TZX5_9HYPH|nr:tRNA (N(6)-L-threonylcarbamoyladenosine(37)-C(2))-methylthiotransferase MtaB [Chelatococcus reniformis]GGC49725.1 tRNA (N(6)-L-threonylcarbamoyladenosine(37)-C(2))-methylthiotransferase MtaB [Chelatococcus reniformis]